MISIHSAVSEANELLHSFQMTQPRKKRRNIIKAFYKFRANQPLNKLEKEALELFTEYIVKVRF